MNSRQDKLHKVSIINQQKIKKALKPIYEQFGVNYFYYSRVSNHGLYASFSNNVDWNKWWFDENVHQELFYFLQPQSYRPGQTISVPLFEQKFDKIGKIAKEKFNINYVLEITYKDKNGIETFGFSTENFNLLTLTQFFSDLTLLKLFFKYFRQKNNSIFEQLLENEIDLAQEIGPAFFQTPYSINSCRHFNFLKDIGMDIFSELSQREKQVCQALTQGLSAANIASMLNLSKRTIECYLENIKEKLNCHSKSELVKKCLDLEVSGYFEVV